ncbi:hypothetical protein Glove_155g132 [Diversispora epigaea]|uniref:Protein kinase domain-containing protein n=1 Tax=Diversispora epigaea TaxID=1348612 RepID=A0A397J185_9GLOM|nr:hypothetical protein Glove_155g132 [Diversispora epigaea]
MSQIIKKIKYCPDGHSSDDFAYSHCKNYIKYGNCFLCTKEHLIQEFKTWSSGNANIDKIIQESQINNRLEKVHWIHYDNFQNIEHIADGGHGSVYSAKIEKGIKCDWNFTKQEWDYDFEGIKVALKETKDSSYIAEFLKVINIVNNNQYLAKYYGISKNPSTQGYIIVMDLFDGDLHNLITKKFWDLGWWELKLDILITIAWSLENSNLNYPIYCNLHTGNILINDNFELNKADSAINLGLCQLENDLILNADNKISKIYGLIPFIPPEVLRGNEFTREGDIYSFGGIMYEMVTAQRPFADQAHDTYLMIDICNGVRPKVPDFMLNWIPEWYLDVMYQCLNDDPSERPTAVELSNLFCEISEKLDANIVDDDVMQQLEISIENKQKAFKSQELFELSTSSSKLHPQSCYISRCIHTLHGLHDLFEAINSGNLSDPNLLLKSNESTISNCQNL